jgi:hypothetical protein
MALIKTCPTCKTVNGPGDMMCSRCYGDVSGVVPVESAPPASAAETAAEPCRTLVLMTAEGEKIPVEDGDVVGRSAAGQEILSRYGKVSRRHAEFRLTAGGWTLRDLGSANGTFIDGVRAGVNESYPVAAGQKIRFSSTFEVEIMAAAS